MHIHPCCLDPVNIGYVKEYHSSARFQQNTLKIWRAFLRRKLAIQQASEPLAEFADGLRTDMLPAPLQRGLEALIAERFQKIVERVGFERGDSVVVIPCDEDCEWRQFGRDLFQDIEAIDPGHLDIQ